MVSRAGTQHFKCEIFQIYRRLLPPVHFLDNKVHVITPTGSYTHGVPWVSIESCLVYLPVHDQDVDEL